MEDRSIREEVVRLWLATDRAPQQPSPGGASDDALQDLQDRAGLLLPPALLDWLRVCKGEAVGPGGVFGARPDRADHDIAQVLARFPHWRGNGWIPVAGDGSGDYYVLLTNGEIEGHVAFIDQADYDQIDYVVASDLWQFLRFLFLSDAGDRRWPFDQEAVIEADPALARSPGALLPWNGD
jgi:cell wall assembly regulator SMI1